ncbi:glycosyltransferase family protein [Pseudodesulfovibrio sp.]|uniref:glycosyltransferase family protein n=1 Tax=unclassified Pseudodesulfovibrio TaxID=2661612 RepID=UPI003AFFF8B1
MRVVFYCQHVLGVGHVFRSLEIARCLAPHEVVLVTGGGEVEITPPENVTREQLPGLMMSPDFKEFIPLEPDAHDVDEVLARRLKRFEAIMERYRPDIFLVELYPFGRRKFRFELLPILQGVRAGRWGRCKSVCSVRDILVEKDNPAKYVSRVNPVLNEWFDAVICHADPAVVRLEETYPGTDGIEIPMHYTGYVARGPKPGAGIRLKQELDFGPQERLIVASAGGGSVGSELIKGALQASPLIQERFPHRLVAFAGPYCPDEGFARLTELAATDARLELRRFTTRFPAYLDAADLSLSLAGYNTTMNLLAAHTYGLVLPFAQNREQHMRAERMERRGAMGLLSPEELVPEVLATRMANALDRPQKAHEVDLDGGRQSARILENLAG